MKKILFIISAFCILSFTTFHPITDKEREVAGKFLKETEEDALKSVKGLSDAQLKFKPGPERWSVEECLKHIAISEINLWHLIDSNVHTTANHDKRSSIKMSDEDVMKNIQDRTNKVKTFPPFEPVNTPYKSAEEAIISFKENRAKLIEYIKTTNVHLRDHVISMPDLNLDSYQMILFIAAHSKRHTKQIEEVKADANFPKN